MNACVQKLFDSPFFVNGEKIKTKSQPTYLIVSFLSILSFHYHSSTLPQICWLKSTHPSVGWDIWVLMSVGWAIWKGEIHHEAWPPSSCFHVKSFLLSPLCSCLTFLIYLHHTYIYLNRNTKEKFSMEICLDQQEKYCRSLSRETDKKEQEAAGLFRTTIPPHLSLYLSSKYGLSLPGTSPPGWHLTCFYGLLRLRSQL